MRYLLSVIDHETGSATPAEITRIDAFNDRLVAQGQWVLACGLAEPSSAAVFSPGDPTPVPGPLYHGDDYVSGLWIIDVADRPTAEEVAREAASACGRRVELRPFFGA